MSIYLALFAADAVTTHQALRMPGAREVFLTQHAAVNDAIVAGQAIGLYAATSKIKRPAVRWTVRLAIGGIHGAAAIYNAKQIRKAR